MTDKPWMCYRLLFLRKVGPFRALNSLISFTEAPTDALLCLNWNIKCCTVAHWQNILHIHEDIVHKRDENPDFKLTYEPTLYFAGNVAPTFCFEFSYVHPIVIFKIFFITSMTFFCFKICLSGNLKFLYILWYWTFFLWCFMFKNAFVWGSNR